MKRSIDLNSDVGEGIGNEAQLLPFLSSCNIACGAHAGDDQTIVQVIELAKQYQVKVGAHPSYPDRANFGRRAMDISLTDLKKTIKEQVERVSAFAKAYDVPLHHIKPHGALYNKAARDEATAKAIIEIVEEIDRNIILYVPYQSKIASIAQGRLVTKLEGFADRAYTDNYTLVPRSREGAVLTTAEAVVAHCIRLLKDELVTLDGKSVPFKMDTLCVHGDNPRALEILQTLTTALDKAHISIQ